MSPVKVVKKKKPNLRLSKAKVRLEEYRAEMAERGKWAKRIYKAQDAKTQYAIDEMIEILSQMADPSGKLVIQFKAGEPVTLDVPPDVFENGWLWVAVRLCNAAYEWDIRVANFKPVKRKREA